MGSNFLVYYFDMEGKAELNQNDSVYCTWFVRCNCPHLGYYIKFGFLWTWNSLLLFPLWFDYIRSMELGRPLGMSAYMFTVLLGHSAAVNSRKSQSYIYVAE